MKILHLFSDQRFTGPAEPVLQMCRALIDRGHEVLLGHRDAGEADRWHKTAAQYGVPTTTELGLNRYWGVRDTLHDIFRMPGFIRRGNFDLIHSHLRHDQIFSMYATRLARLKRCPIVHTLHQRDVLANKTGYRFLLRNTDGLLAFTNGFRQQYIEQFGIQPQRIGVQPMTVDTEGLDPARTYLPMRNEFGIDNETIVIGIVGRFQEYRKMDIFLAAAKRFAEQNPDANVRFLVIGRSRAREQTVDRPVREMGLEKHVVIGGYRTKDYNDTLACMDIFTLLMPGSDGTARAVRQAMAIGCPCVVSDYGMLPEIVPHEVAGLVAEMDANAIADAWARLVNDASLRSRLAKGARQEAVNRFNPESVGANLESFYQQILDLPRV